MPTTLLRFQNDSGQVFMAQALLDSYSTVNLITENFANLVNLTKQRCSVNIGAIHSLHTTSNHYVKASISSMFNNFSRVLHFLIVPKIADFMPTETFQRDLFKIPKNLQLADPQFHVPRTVDILLAAGVTFAALSVGQIRLQYEQSNIILQKTSLGWIVVGGSDFLTSPTKSSCHVVKLDKLIERFWIIEDFDSETRKSRDEVACEQHYIENTRRDPGGRYIVRLPFRNNKINLGESRSQALKRFYALERKFESNSSFKTEYSKVMEEYISLGHMTLCDDAISEGYYLPHHAVFKTSSETTKCRVVFDASSKTSTGVSLNDVLMIGPTIQPSIFEQILRFRGFRYVITADIKQMYRQVLIHSEDRKFQKTLWYFEGKIRTFLMNTLVFGTASAAFLAIRTLQQLALDEAHRFPRVWKLLLEDFYVDDLITGADSLEEILKIRDEMIDLLNSGGFIIRQWASNHKYALNNIDKKYFDLDCLINENVVHKTLGIVWDSEIDVLKYTVSAVNIESKCTKRQLLSEISKIYDPLGLLGPVILYAKTLIQECWKIKLTWDESLPQAIHTKWKMLAEQLPQLREFTIPRYLLDPNSVCVEIHGFCDACLYGYGACLFVRCINDRGQISTKLICSKSRVAPLNGVTIPRLELCAASVLKKLYVKANGQFNFRIDKVVFWSDSTIVLCCLKKALHLLRTFESNRVADIQSLGDEVQWRHIRSEDNPADSLSRGQLPVEFIKNTLWTTGPFWLSHPESQWPPSLEPSLQELPGLKEGTCLLNIPSCDFIYSRFSSFTRLSRVVALLLRWRFTPKSARGRPLTSDEIFFAEKRIVSMVQRENFATEIRLLDTSRAIDHEDVSRCIVPFRRPTRFDELNPFLDVDGLIRVGGRLKKADLIYNQKHPLLLPARHHVSDLIIRKFHETNLHAGIQSTLHAIRGHYWILNGKNQVRRIVHRCVECIRQKPKFLHTQMADLPEARVTEAPAFCRTGVDFFGPVLIKERRFRNKTFIKTYGCVFVCMSSKAVHIELATDLSADGFLAAFRRFIGRRGVPEHVFSDNGTNFVGADKAIREVYNLFKTTEFTEPINAFAVSKGVQWHFNPPLSSHFGGLWEAAVKSFKHHLKRVLKDQKLTYEQMNTLLIDIEAIFNSRPLYALSSDPNDPTAITPAHLLIGRPFNFLPEKNFVPVPDNRLSTHEFIIKARQSFWDKWYKEYLNELQVRRKWQSSSNELKIGDVVILREDNLACARWPLGVIISLSPGSDGLVRVATVRTTNGTYKRNVTRLCILPTS